MSSPQHRDQYYFLVDQMDPHQDRYHLVGELDPRQSHHQLCDEMGHHCRPEEEPRPHQGQPRALSQQQTMAPYPWPLEQAWLSSKPCKNNIISATFAKAWVKNQITPEKLTLSSTRSRKPDAWTGDSTQRPSRSYSPSEGSQVSKWYRQPIREFSS